MKYIKIAVMSLLAAAVFGSCTKKTVTPGPGTGVVGFTQTEVTMQETDGLTYIPIAVTGEPGGYPVTLKITAEGAENVNDVLLITSTDPYSSTTTLYIGEDANNTVNLQVAPAWRPDDNADYTITLTITDATGAAIGTASTCTIYIKNVQAVQYGQYTISGGQGSTPATWSMMISEGANGTYLMSNIFDSTETPVLVGEFNPETMELTFDGRINGKGTTNYFASTPYNNEILEEGQYMKYWLIQGGGNDGQEPVVFTVNDQYQISGTASTMIAVSMRYISNGEGGYGPTGNDEDTTYLGIMTGNTTATYEGEGIEDEYPFKKK